MHSKAALTIAIATLLVQAQANAPDAEHGSVDVDMNAAGDIAVLHDMNYNINPKEYQDINTPNNNEILLVIEEYNTNTDEPIQRFQESSHEDSDKILMSEQSLQNELKELKSNNFKPTTHKSEHEDKDEDKDDDEEEHDGKTKKKHDDDEDLEDEKPSKKHTHHKDDESYNEDAETDEKDENEFNEDKDIDEDDVDVSENAYEESASASMMSASAVNVPFVSASASPSAHPLSFGASGSARAPSHSASSHPSPGSAKIQSKSNGSIMRASVGITIAVITLVTFSVL